MHECFQCLRLCFCDGEDLLMPQPANCRHFCEYDDDDDENDYEHGGGD